MALSDKLWRLSSRFYIDAIIFMIIPSKSAAEPVQGGCYRVPAPTSRKGPPPTPPGRLRFRNFRTSGFDNILISMQPSSGAQGSELSQLGVFRVPSPVIHTGFDRLPVLAVS